MTSLPPVERGIGCLSCGDLSPFTAKVCASCGYRLVLSASELLSAAVAAESAELLGDAAAAEPATREAPPG